jgi:Domain of unknown function (DUF5667)
VSRYDDNDQHALDRLEDLLDAYAEARLAPPGAVLARMRANVMLEASAAAATYAAIHRPRLVQPAPRPVRAAFVPRLSRLAFTMGFAAVLTLGTSAAVLAAPPGSPFYNARVYLETALLPSQPGERTAGHEKLLEERIAEAEAAAQRGDTIALAAALAAFQTEVDAATDSAGEDLALLAHLQEMLAKHTAVLTALAATLPEQPSIENAIESSSKAIAKLQQKTHRVVRPTHAPAGGNPGGEHDGDRPAGGANGGEQ